MKQISLASGFRLVTKRTRKRGFLDEIHKVIPWSDLLTFIAPHATEGETGRPPFATEVILRIHLLQEFFGYSDPAMEEALHEMVLYREFARLETGRSRLPDESTILRFRHLLLGNELGQKILDAVNAQLVDHGLLLKAGTVVDATLISSPSFTKYSMAERDPEMHQTKNDNQWCHGINAHIRVDGESGLVHTVNTTAANEYGITQAANLLHGKESDVFDDSGYRGLHKHEEVQEQHPDVNWHVAMMPSQRKALDMKRLSSTLYEQLEKLKANVRAKVEPPFRGIDCQFGHRKTRYRDLAKNTTQLLVMFALSNFWVVRKRILQEQQA